MQNPTLSGENPFPIIAQIAVRVDISVECDRFDAQFLTKFWNRCIGDGHSGLRHVFRQVYLFSAQFYVLRLAVDVVFPNM